MKEDFADAAWTAKQIKFFTELVKHWNASRAAKDAGYKETTAARMGQENLQKPHIAAAIRAHQRDLVRQTGVTTERTVRELADVAFSNMADYFEKDGQTLKNIHEMPEGAQRAISEIVIDQNKKDGIKRARLKLHSKEGPADKLMKHLGGYDQHNRQKGPLEVVERLPSKKSPYLVADVRIDRSQNRRTAS